MSNDTKLSVATQAAREAGKILLKHYGHVKERYKGPRHDAGTIVTVADKESERKIVSILKRHFPEHGFHGEEFTSENEDAEYVWYIDPLDGTSNYVRNLPMWGISIGLIRKGKPVLGVLFFPLLDLMVHAERGMGAYANGKRIRVSGRSLPESLYFSGGKFRGKRQIVPAIFERAALVKIIGASSLELAKIAMGDAEIYYLRNSPHDVIAGICIVEESGGMVSDSEGMPWKIDSKEVLITNGKVHREVLKLLS